MSIQECALYGDLVLYLRDHVAAMLVEAKIKNSPEEAEQQSERWKPGLIPPTRPNSSASASIVISYLSSAR